MTTRERNLAVVLLVLLAGGGGLLLANIFYFDPASALQTQLETRQQQLALRDKDLLAERDRIKEIIAINPRLAKWEKLSLPAPEALNPLPEALKSHYARLRGEYQKEIEKLMDRSGFTLGPIRSLEADTRTSPVIRPKVPLYTIFAFTLEGESDLLALARVFEGFYKMPLLHQIRSFEANPIASKSAGGKTMLFTKMNLEVLLVDGAERLDKKDKDKKQEPKRPGLLPLFSGKGDDKAPVMLAADLPGNKGRKYDDIAKKNIFAPPPVRVSTGPKTDSPPREDPEDVFPFVKLNQITFSDYYGVWTARIVNQGNRADSALLCAGPLPETSRFVRLQKELEKRVEEKKKAEARLLQGNLNAKDTAALTEKISEGNSAEAELKTLEKPVTKWAVKDKYKETQAELQIVRIDPLRVIFQTGGDLHVLYLDNMSLQEALDQTLNKAEMKDLGLGGDRDATLKKVELTKIEFEKDRKTYEGHFVNPSYKNEKMVLSTEAKPEEEFAPDDWKIRDSFGAEQVKLAVVKMEKERIIFTVQGEKKFYAIKAGGNLFDALAKPLSDAEVKELQLKSP